MPWWMLQLSRTGTFFMKWHGAFDWTYSASCYRCGSQYQHLECRLDENEESCYNLLQLLCSHTHRFRRMTIYLHNADPLSSTSYRPSNFLPHRDRCEFEVSLRNLTECPIHFFQIGRRGPPFYGHFIFVLGLAPQAHVLRSLWLSIQ